MDILERLNRRIKQCEVRYGRPPNEKIAYTDDAGLLIDCRETIAADMRELGRLRIDNLRLVGQVNRPSIEYWKPIDYGALEYAHDTETRIIGWWSKDGHWQWVSAHWTGDEWDAGEWVIDHCRPTHWLQPSDLPLPPFVLDDEPAVLTHDKPNE